MGTRPRRRGSSGPHALCCSSRTWTNCPTCRRRCRRGSEGMSIKKRLGQTRFLTPQPPRSREAEQTESAGDSPSHATASAATCRCSIGWPWTWARPATYEDLCRSSWTACWKHPAEVGAILSMPAAVQRRHPAGRHAPNGRAPRTHPPRGQRSGSDGPSSPRPQHARLQPRLASTSATRCWPAARPSWPRTWPATATCATAKA